MSRRLRQLVSAIHGFILIPKVWSCPRRAKIAVFYDTNLWVLTPLFGGEHYEVIDFKKFFITPRIIISTLWYVFKGCDLKVAYAMALLGQIKPAIVVTYIDNSRVFQETARRVQRIRFLAIQNGHRLLHNECPPGSPPLYLREFACIGRYEIEQYALHGVQVNKYYPIGSLKDSYFRSKCTNGKPKQFDVCLVSQVKPGLQNKYSERLESFELLMQYVSQFCESHRKSVCIALRRHPDFDLQSYQWEREYFTRYFGSNAQIFPNIPGAYTTYELMDLSWVSVGMNSTLMREGFGRRNKILSCNFTGNSTYDFPVEGPWFLNDADYKVFEQRLLCLLGMSDEEYKKLCGDFPEYLISYDHERPTHIFLKNLIADAVKETTINV